MRRFTPRHHPRPAPPAFTLIELMVVVIIIAALIAILIPSVGGARNAARRSDTQGMLNRIAAAVQMFHNDERRYPGYFSEKAMGHQDNLTRGMSSMENVMFDLVGILPQQTTAAPAGSVEVGPMQPATGQPAYYVDPDAFDQAMVAGPDKSPGAKLYFVPDAKHYVAQLRGTQQMGTVGHTDAAGQPQLKDVVDAWGMPLLAWRQNEASVQLPGPPGASARDYVVQAYTGASAAVPSAWFYWASNACFLKAPAAGRGYNQPISDANMAVTGTAPGSMIGGPDSTPASFASGEALRSLVSVIGNPNFPYRGNVNPNQAGRLPYAPRSPFILHSAGRDGYFVGNKDRGRKQFSVSHVDFEFNYVVRAGGDPNNPNDVYHDKDGKPTNQDVIQPFDDVVVPVGN